MNSKYFKITSLAALLAVVVSGCGVFSGLDKVVPDNSTKYRKAETMPALDVPPDLSSSRINDDILASQKSSISYSEFEEAATNPLARKYNITPETKPALSSKGDKRHLMVPSEREVTWQRVLDFWKQKGIAIKRKDIRIGLMETEAGRDSYGYRVRIERGDTLKRTKVFVSGASSSDIQKNEAMLRQLAEFLGALQQKDNVQTKVEKQSQPHLIAVNAVLIDETDGHQSLQVEQDFTQLWRRVGRILDSKGFAVENRDRSRGTYFVRYIDPSHKVRKEGLFDKLSFWRDTIDKAPGDFYHIKLISSAANTKIIVLDAEEVRTSSDTAKRLLSFMQEQLVK